jgi:two-component system sensor histidine kinase SenX3
MDALPLGLVISGSDGRVSHTNRTANRLRDGGVRTALAWQAILDLAAAVRGDGRPRRRELELHGPPHQSLVIEATRPEPYGEVVTVIRDVTEMRQLEAVRRDFVANVSHELRTPIGAIAVLADALASAPGAEDAERLAQRVRAEAGRLTELVSDLLDLSRIEAVRPDPLDGPVDVIGVVSKAVERCRPACEHHEVLVDFSRVVEPAEVSGDEDQLVSAVANLLENAAKYSEPGDPIEVSVATSGGEAVIVTVRDRGVGIPSWELERVFERFYRVDRARHRGSGGTGLGLAIVRNVATNHGGTVTVESREGEGSTFVLTLPRRATTP